MQKLNREELAKLVKMSKFDQVLYLLEKYDNYVPLQVYAAQICYFTVQQVKDICDMTSMFREQLEDEGKMHYWCDGLVDSIGDALSVNVLPIYGLRDRYETKWFTETRDEVIRKALREKNRNLYSCIIEFQLGDTNEN